MAAAAAVDVTVDIAITIATTVEKWAAMMNVHACCLC